MREARALLRAGHHDGAYYLTGMAVECAIKACIAKRTRRYEFPERDRVVESYTHDLAKLIRTAGLQAELNRDVAGDPAFARACNYVKDWTVDSRYAGNSRQAAETLYQAVTTRNSGMLRWIRKHW